MVSIGVKIEQAGSGRRGQFGQDARLATLAHVDRALKHGCTVAHQGKPDGSLFRRINDALPWSSMLLANIFGPDIIIVLVIAVVLLFGAGQLPKLARSIGEASKEFKKSQQEAEEAAKADAAKADAAKTDAAKTDAAKTDAAKPADDDKITMSKAELDALLAEREAKAKRESETPPSA
jgi:TatA/E family protein of Tat protein translocase